MWDTNNWSFSDDGSDNNSGFWASLTYSILGAGQQYFQGQQYNNYSLASQGLWANMFSSLIKGVLIIVVVGGIIKLIFFGRK